MSKFLTETKEFYSYFWTGYKKGRGAKSFACFMTICTVICFAISVLLIIVLYIIEN